MPKKKTASQKSRDKISAGMKRARAVRGHKKPGRPAEYGPAERNHTAVRRTEEEAERWSQAYEAEMHSFGLEPEQLRGAARGTRPIGATLRRWANQRADQILGPRVTPEPEPAPVDHARPTLLEILDDAGPFPEGVPLAGGVGVDRVGGELEEGMLVRVKGDPERVVMRIASLEDSVALCATVEEDPADVVLTDTFDVGELEAVPEPAALAG